MRTITASDAMPNAVFTTRIASAAPSMPSERAPRTITGTLTSEVAALGEDAESRTMERLEDLAGRAREGW